MATEPSQMCAEWSAWFMIDYRPTYPTPSTLAFGRVAAAIPERSTRVIGNPPAKPMTVLCSSPAALPAEVQ